MEFSLQRSHFPGHNANSSLGPDGIHLRALNQLKDEITPLQAAVCNLSLGIVCIRGWEGGEITNFYKGFQG